MSVASTLFLLQRVVRTPPARLRSHVRSVRSILIVSTISKHPWTSILNNWRMTSTRLNSSEVLIIQSVGHYTVLLIFCTGFSRRSTAVHLWPLRQGVQTQTPFNGTQASPQRREAIPVPQVCQDVQPFGVLQPAHQPPIQVLPPADGGRRRDGRWSKPRGHDESSRIRRSLELPSNDLHAISDQTRHMVWCHVIVAWSQRRFAWTLHVISEQVSITFTWTPYDSMTGLGSRRSCTETQRINNCAIERETWRHTRRLNYVSFV